MRGESIVNKPIITVHRLLVAALCCVATWLIPSTASAERLRPDNDGDGVGVHDRIGVSRRPFELAIRLSTAQHWQRLNDHLNVKFVVTDVDRDGDPDLVVRTRRSGLQVWINKGRGLFFSATRARELRTRRLHLVTRGFGRSVRGVQSARWDDSALNDPTRLFIVWSAPPRAHLVAVCPAPAAACAAVPNLAGHRPTPRGPPRFFS